MAFELKTEKFKPEHLGQQNFYLEALDRNVKKAIENPSIGVLLCKDKDDEVVVYALSRSLSPTMVAEYQLCLPDKKLLQQKMHEIADNNMENRNESKQMETFGNTKLLQLYKIGYFDSGTIASLSVLPILG